MNPQEDVQMCANCNQPIDYFPNIKRMVLRWKHSNGLYCCEGDATGLIATPNQPSTLPPETEAALPDWGDDEKVVRAAVPTMLCEFWSGNQMWVVEEGNGSMALMGASPERYKALAKARHHPTVVAYEAQRNPAKRPFTPSDAPGVDWGDDKAVVKAAVPTAYQTGKAVILCTETIHDSLFPHFIGNSWESARQHHPTVVAYEAEWNPAKRPPVEHPERVDSGEGEPSGDNRQARVHAWCVAAFGAEQSSSVPQRGLRLLEEAAETAQAAEVDLPQAHKLLDYVWSRPVGELSQEVGGLRLTTLALAAAAGFSADAAELTEIRRVLAKPLAHFKQRNQAKNDAGFLAPPTGGNAGGEQGVEDRLELPLNDDDWQKARELFGGRPTALIVGREAQDEFMLKSAAEFLCLLRLFTDYRKVQPTPAPESGANFEEWWQSAVNDERRSSKHAAMNKGTASLAWRVAKTSPTPQAVAGVELPELDVTTEDVRAAYKRYDLNDSRHMSGGGHTRHEHASVKCRERQLRTALRDLQEARVRVGEAEEDADVTTSAAVHADYGRMAAEKRAEAAEAELSRLKGEHSK